jgi:DNA-binding NarL/FixJ family response regulator
MRPVTERQSQVARLYAKGDGKREIAHKLSISYHTVSHHLGNFYVRAGVCDRGGLICFLVKRGVISIDEVAGQGTE